MKWFYNLRRLYRNIIAGALWGVLLLVAGIAGGIYGDNVDNMHPAVAVVVVALLVGAIVFTVFASIATKNERRANNQKTTPPRKIKLSTIYRVNARPTFRLIRKV